jgi:MerR family transcriptional regulator, mercuric resistance operon regulatory protein
VQIETIRYYEKVKMLPPPPRTQGGRRVYRSCAEVQTLTAAHLGEVRVKIADLRKLEALLARALEQCLVETTAPACPVLDMLASPRMP